MKVKYILLLVYLSTFVHSSTIISFSTSGDGYTVANNIVTITNDGSYDLSTTETDKKIIVSSSCTLNLKSFKLTNSGDFTPIVISSGKEVEIVLTGESFLSDSSNNENDGIIFLQSEATLIISGSGTLNINPNKLMAINGEDSTSLTVNDGPTIKIESNSSDAGGIYIKKDITFNNAIFSYSCSIGENPAIKSEGSIKLIKGTYNINSGEAKGIQSGNYLYLGEEGGDNLDLALDIHTSYEAIEAQKIEIYSGNINIVSAEGGIKAHSSVTDNDGGNEPNQDNSACYIIYKGGSLYMNSGENGINSSGDITISGGKIIVFTSPDAGELPIAQEGVLKITGGTILAAGTPQEGEIIGQTTQIVKTYKEDIISGAKLIAKDNNNNEIINLTTPQNVNYLYFNHKSNFTITVDGQEIELSETSQSQDCPEGENCEDSQTDDYEDDEPIILKTNGFFLRNLKITLILSLFIL